MAAKEIHVIYAMEELFSVNVAVKYSLSMVLQNDLGEEYSPPLFFGEVEVIRPREDPCQEQVCTCVPAKAGVC